MHPNQRQFPSDQCLALPPERLDRERRHGSETLRIGSRARRGLRFARRVLVDESGSATAEYAVATMAAVGFAGLLVLILRGDEVRGILTDLVRRALTVAG